MGLQKLGASSLGEWMKRVALVCGSELAFLDLRLRRVALGRLMGSNQYVKELLQNAGKAWPVMVAAVVVRGARMVQVRQIFPQPKPKDGYGGVSDCSPRFLSLKPGRRCADGGSLVVPLASSYVQ